MLKKIFLVFIFLLVIAEETVTDLDQISAPLSNLYNAFKHYTPLPLPTTLAELILLVLLLGALGTTPPFRKSESRITIMKAPLLVFGILLGISTIYGLVILGGDWQHGMWQVRPLSYALICYFITPRLLSTQADLKRLEKTMLCGVLVLDTEIVLRYLFLVKPGIVTGDLVYDHNNALILSIFLLGILIRVLFGVTTNKWPLLCIAAVTFVITLLMHRRIAFVELILGGILVGLVLARDHTRLLLKILPVAVLLTTIYLALYWNSQGTLGTPARVIKAAVFGQRDMRDTASDLYRRSEKGNIILNIKDHPLTGLGFGQELILYITMPDLSWWSEWHYTTHNEILWVWLEMGPLGFLTFLTLIGSALAQTAYFLRQQQSKELKAFLLTAGTAIFMQFGQSYYDLGLTSAREMCFFGVALGLISYWRQFMPANFASARSEPLVEKQKSIVGVRGVRRELGVLASVRGREE